MANGWREQIDNYHRRKEEEEARKEKKKEEKHETKLRRKGERERAVREKQLARHKRWFRCHICGKPSDGPAVLTSYYVTVGEGETCDRSYEHLNVPTGLYKCDRCSNWTCDDHIYRGICAKCASNL